MKKIIVTAIAALAIIFLHSCASTGSGTDGLSLTDAVEQSAERIAGEVPPGTRIAIVVFETDSGELSAFIIEELTGALLDRKIEVVNRQSIKYVEQELNFQTSGAVSDESAKSVGQFLGADIVIIGQLRNLGSTYRFTVNATFVESAKLASVPRFTVRNDRELQDMIVALGKQTSIATIPNALIQQATPQTAGTFLDRGIMLAMQGKYDPAIADFTEAIRLNPNLVGAYMLRGRALTASAAQYINWVSDNFENISTTIYSGKSISAEQSRLHDRAIADFSEAIRLDPNNAAAYRERGWSYMEKGNFDTAIKDFNQAIQINPNYADAYNGRGIAYNGKGDDDRNIADQTQAIRLNPNSLDAYVTRGNAYYGKRDYDRALADYNQAIRLNPNDADGYNGRGNVYRNKGDYDRALADYNQAIRLNPNYLDYAYVTRGNVYYGKRDYDRALADYEAALRINPNYADAYNGRGSVYYSKGDYNRAIADYEAALRIDPNYANAKSNLENARKARGR